MFTRWLAAALGLLLLVGGLATHGSAAPGADVTLNATTYRNANGILAIVFSGTVASDAPGQIVEVLGRECGGRGSRLISSARTRAGGGWEVENPERQFPFRHAPWTSGTTFQARWNGQLSTPFVVLLPAPLSAVKVKGRRAWRVYTSSPSPGWVSMKGKIVQLQRLRGRSWVTIARKPLVYKPRTGYSAFNHEAVFPVPARGWILRAFLPAKSALPCYQAATTPQWRT